MRLNRSSRDALLPAGVAGGDALLRELSALRAPVQELVIFRFVDRALRVTLPLLLRARGHGDMAATLEDLEEIRSIDDVELALVTLQRLGDGVELAAIADGARLLLAAQQPPAARVHDVLQAARALSSSCTLETSLVIGSPSGAPLPVRALVPSGEEELVEEMRAALAMTADM